MAQGMHEEQNMAKKRFSKIRHGSISTVCPWSCLLAQWDGGSAGTLEDTWLSLNLVDGVWMLVGVLTRCLRDMPCAEDWEQISPLPNRV